jgi:hypothetical protein
MPLQDFEIKSSSSSTAPTHITAGFYSGISSCIVAPSDRILLGSIPAISKYNQHAAKGKK